MPKISGWTRKQELETRGNAMPFVWKRDGGQDYVVIQRSTNPDAYRTLRLNKSEVNAFKKRLNNANQVTPQTYMDILGMNPARSTREIKNIELPVVNGEGRERIRKQTVEYLRNN